MSSSLEIFLADVETFLERHAMDPTRFGVEALKDPRFVFDLRAGRAPRLSTVDRVRRYMAESPHSGSAA